MSHCCDSQKPLCENMRDNIRDNNRKRRCPVDGSECSPVAAVTMRHQLKSPWQQPLSAQRYYFCDSPLCDVVYFGDDGTVFTIDALRGPIGQKQVAGFDKIICYCFGVTQADAQNDPAVKAFVVQQTKEGHCACEARNPSGRCCLKDFPRQGE